MNDIMLLDCTLRDGAYLIDKKFGTENIRGITDGLVNAGIDFVEVGFFQNEGFGEGKTVYLNSAQAKEFIPQNKRNSKFTVLADYSRYSVENLDVCSEDSIDGVRECFFKKERFDALEACKQIKEKGYLVFVQPVDILGYTDKEILDLIERINEIEPYCLSIVDTFGSMYQEDLHRIFELINHNLVLSCKIGFHSHNNMQLSNALSQEFIRIAAGKRGIIIDGTLSGMGRGAGNTPTELIAQYLISKMHCNYNLDSLLDTLDTYIDNIRTRCEWGYTIPYFIAGCFSAHVNNIAYLNTKNSIRYKDIRYILNHIGNEERKRYEYSLLEKKYMEYLSSEIDDSAAIEKLRKIFDDMNVLILAPGNTLKTCKEKINDYIKSENPIVVCINFIGDDFKTNFIYMSNLKRFQLWNENKLFRDANKIIASNLPQNLDDEKTYRVSFTKLVKCGWSHMDNSTLMLLRLLDEFDCKKIALGGFDGYLQDVSGNYYNSNFEITEVKNNAMIVNQEISEMLLDFYKTRKHKQMAMEFVTPSRFEKMLYENTLHIDGGGGGTYAKYFALGNIHRFQIISHQKGHSA